MSISLNKLVHETRDKCWHIGSSVVGKMYVCGKCDSMMTENPDYEGDMNACMELWEEGRLLEMRRFRGSENMDPYWRTWSHTEEARAETPQLAIIHAYLKSKGVELETTND